MLNAIYITETVFNVRKRGKGVAAVLNSPKNIENRKRVNQIKQEKKERKIQKKQMIRNPKAKGNRKRRPSFDTNSEDEQEVILNDEETTDDDLEDYENECAGCNEDYRTSQKKDDWIKCLICDRWLNEGCTSFINLCQLCGKHTERRNRYEFTVVHQ